MPLLYVDVLLLINFLMNLFLLTIVRKIFRIQAGYKRICLAAITGAIVYVCLKLIKDPVYLHIIVGNLFLPITMIIIAFRTKNIESIITWFITLYILAFLFGGIFTFIFESFSFSYSLKIVMSILMIFATRYSIHLIVNRLRKEMNTYIVTIGIHGHFERVKGYIDTGNNLYEPLSGNPVMLAEDTLIESMITDSDWFRIRVIPFHSVGKEKGILYAFPVDVLEIEALNIKKEHVFVAMYSGIIGRECRVLLHPDILNTD